MARRPKPSPSFFKVLFRNFNLRLRLPPIFVRNQGEILPENVTLTTESGESWKVKLEEDEGHRYFTKGWVKFVEDLHLKMGTFLVFRLVGTSTMMVSVYGLSACEMEPRDCKTETADLSLRRSPRIVAKGKQIVCSSVKEEAWIPPSDDKPESSGRKKNPQFQVVLTKRHLYSLEIYKSFAIETELLDKRFAVLEDPQGHYVAVALAKRIERRYFRFVMTAGWNDFRKDNNIVVGDTCSFEFIPSKNVIRVKVIKGRN